MHSCLRNILHLLGDFFRIASWIKSHLAFAVSWNFFNFVPPAYFLKYQLEDKPIICNSSMKFWKVPLWVTNSFFPRLICNWKQFFRLKKESICILKRRKYILKGLILGSFLVLAIVCLKIHALEESFINPQRINFQSCHSRGYWLTDPAKKQSITPKLIGNMCPNGLPDSFRYFLVISDIF